MVVVGMIFLSQKEIQFIKFPAYFKRDEINHQMGFA